MILWCARHIDELKVAIIAHIFESLYCYKYNVWNAWMMRHSGVTKADKKIKFSTYFWLSAAINIDLSAQADGDNKGTIVLLCARSGYEEADVCNLWLFSNIEQADQPTCWVFSTCLSSTLTYRHLLWRWLKKVVLDWYSIPAICSLTGARVWILKMLKLWSYANEPPMQLKLTPDEHLSLTSVFLWTLILPIESPGIASTMLFCWLIQPWSSLTSSPPWHRWSHIKPPRGSLCLGWSSVQQGPGSSSCWCPLWSKRNGTELSTRQLQRPHL